MNGIRTTRDSIVFPSVKRVPTVTDTLQTPRSIVMMGFTYRGICCTFLTLFGVWKSYGEGWEEKVSRVYCKPRGKKQQERQTKQTKHTYPTPPPPQQQQQQHQTTSTSTSTYLYVMSKNLPSGGTNDKTFSFLHFAIRTHR